MKIVIIDNAAINKKEDNFFIYRSTGEFGAELHNLGNKVEFFQLSKIIDSSISSYDLKKNNLSFSTSRIYSFKILTYLQAYLKGMWKILHTDFLYIFYPNSFSYLAFFAIIVGKKFGLYIRGEEGIHSRKSKLLYRYASTIFTVSNSFTDRINNGLSILKCHTIKPMISFSNLDVVNDRVYIDNRLSKILFLGRVDKNKGLAELLGALKKLKDIGMLKFQLQVVGDGPYLDELCELAAQLGITDSVNFLGTYTNLEDIKKIYMDSDAYILPTYHEGFPRTLYEAMIFGTPIITTFVGGIPGIMKDGYNCFKIEPKSIDSIVEKIIFLNENYDTAGKKIAENAIKTVSAILNQDKISHAEHLNKNLKEND